MKFLADRTTGKLARKLRALGFDVVSWDGGDLEEAAAHASGEGRILLTRSRRVPKSQEEVRVLTLEADQPREQLREVLDKLGLEARPEQFFTRCLICNEILVSVSKEEVEGRVPDFVYRAYHVFHVCPRCRRIYWPGTHLERMKRNLGRAVSPQEGEKER